MRPNVLLLVFDAGRRDAFEPYGAPAGSSPAVAQLASRGAALPAVHSTAPWTVPSHASIFTGLMPRAAGLSEVPSPVAAKSLLEPHRARFLPEVLRQAGYRTAGVSANPWASDLSGFDAGFDSFTLVDSGRTARIDAKGPRDRLRWLAEGVRGRVDDGARAAEDALADVIASRADRPLFAFVNLVECHFPYLPPRPYGDLSALDRLRATEDARRYFTLEAIYRVNARVLEVPDATLERARRLYAAAVRYMDDWLARVLERLDGAGMLDDTLVIATADHGENFGEGGLVAHMLSLDQRLINVPFVVAGPGADRFDLASLASLPRCVAEAVGLGGHPWTDGPPPGFGLAQSNGLGDAADPDVQRRLDDAGAVDPAGRERLTDVLTCAVRGDLKLVRHGDGREELYDLAADPLETAPLPASGADGERAPAVADLRAALDHPSMAVAKPVAAGPSAQQSAEEMEDLEARMKLLGYM